MQMNTCLQVFICIFTGFVIMIAYVRKSNDG